MEKNPIPLPVTISKVVLRISQKHLPQNIASPHPEKKQNSSWNSFSYHRNLHTHDQSLETKIKELGSVIRKVSWTRRYSVVLGP